MGYGSTRKGHPLRQQWLCDHGTKSAITAGSVAVVLYYKSVTLSAMAGNPLRAPPTSIPTTVWIDWLMFLLRHRRIFTPDTGEGGLDLLLEAGDQFAVGGDQRLLGFDLGDDGLLRGEGWEGNWDAVKIP